MREFAEVLAEYLEVMDTLNSPPDRQQLIAAGHHQLVTDINESCGFRYLVDVIARKRQQRRQELLLGVLAEYTGEETNDGEGIMPPRYFETVRNRRDADHLARNVLGRYLVREFPAGDQRRMLLTDLGVYYGIASSTSGKGYMGVPTGTVWVNTRYGHKILNIATGDDEHPGCLVVRGGMLETTRGEKELKGPGAVTRSLQIGHNLTGTRIGDGLWIEGRQVNGEVRIDTPSNLPDNCLGYYELYLEDI